MDGHDGDALQRAQQILGRLQQNLAQVIYGKRRNLQWLLAGFASGGHVLLEDVPGTGKTTLAKALARSCAADFQRIQFTPDLLPSDILGITLYDQQRQAFRFEPGPVFCHILLADEINRASPRTQSALLEAMAEGQVSIERQVRPLPTPFFVIATQNPVEYHGTYPLPEAQLDRFALCFGLGYVDVEQEIELLAKHGQRSPLQDLPACIGLDDLQFLQRQVHAVRVSDEVRRYIVNIVAATRGHRDIKLAASARASLALLKCAQALALLDGYGFVPPETVRELAPLVIAHRLGLDAQSKFSGTDAGALVGEIVAKLPMPR